MSFNIIGTGSSVPKKTVTNNDLTAFLDTNDEWIRTRTGICERRVMTDENILDLAYGAAKNALSDAKTDASEIDFLIFSTLAGDFVSPSMCCLLSKMLGINSGRQLDINMGCSGFLYALDTADAYFRSGKVNKALIVCAEGMSRVCDWTDRSTAVLFGDAAGAIVLEKGDGFKEIKLTVDGAYENLYIQSSKGNLPYLNIEKADSYLKMNGQEIYIFAVSAVVKEINGLLESLGITAEETDYFILHQANSRIIESARKKLGQPTDKFPVNLDKYGNTSSASIPLLLDELNKQNRLKKGQKIVFCSFGAGLTSAAAYLVW